MSRTCTICRHEWRHDVEVALVRRDPYRDIARRFLVSKDALSRHTKEHLPDRLLKAQEHENVQEALNVVGQLRTINAASLAILEEARHGGDSGTALRAVDRIQKQIELQAKLLGELEDRPQVVLIAPQVQYAIVRALEPFPEARLAVVAALDELEEQSVS